MNGDPLGMRQVQFDQVLDRLEAAVTGYSPNYGPLEYQADMNLVHQFMAIWDGLDHRVQRAYAVRIARLKLYGKGQTT
jgi:hypothetical protein